MQRLLVGAGRLNASRIPPACVSEQGGSMVIIRCFPLHRFAVSLHHRLISLLPPVARGRDIIDMYEVEKADPAYESGSLNDRRMQLSPEIRLR